MRWLPSAYFLATPKARSPKVPETRCRMCIHSTMSTALYCHIAERILPVSLTFIPIILERVCYFLVEEVEQFDIFELSFVHFHLHPLQLVIYNTIWECRSSKVCRHIRNGIIPSKGISDALFWSFILKTDASKHELIFC